MAADLDKRRAALQDLIRGEQPLEHSIRNIRSFTQDCAVELVRFDVEDIVRAVKRYCEGRWTADEIEEWANALEGREDVSISQEVIEALFVLANPALHGELTPVRAQAVANQLGHG